ncbi:MAG: ACT domain-containing protein [Elusimicrobiota bacterium]
MNIKQVSVFIENQKGRLAEVTKVLADNGINIRALALADTADFGVLRLIVNDTEKCVATLKKNNFVAQVTEVTAVEVDDQPGGLAKMLSLFDKQGINVEYMYATVEKKSDRAIVVFRFDNPKSALETLKKNGISIVTEDIIKNL